MDVKIRWIRVCGFCALLLCSAWVNADEIKRIVYVTTDDYMIADYDTAYSHEVEIFNLDYPSTFEQQLIANLPKRKALREDYIKDMFSRLGQDRFRTVFGASAYAERFDLKRAPAFVINDKYVIYGLTSAKQAIEKFNRYRMR